MKKQPKTIVLGDTQFVVDRYYKEGVAAFRNNTPWSCNPYRDRTHAYEQWDYGHTNESAGEHKGLVI